MNHYFLAKNINLFLLITMLALVFAPAGDSLLVGRGTSRNRPMVGIGLELGLVIWPGIGINCIFDYGGPWLGWPLAMAVPGYGGPAPCKDEDAVETWTRCIQRLAVERSRWVQRLIVDVDWPPWRRADTRRRTRSRLSQCAACIVHRPPTHTLQPTHHVWLSKSYRQARQDDVDHVERTSTGLYPGPEHLQKKSRSVDEILCQTPCLKSFEYLCLFCVCYGWLTVSD